LTTQTFSRVPRIDIEKGIRRPERNRRLPSDTVRKNQGLDFNTPYRQEVVRIGEPVKSVYVGGRDERKTTPVTKQGLRRTAVKSKRERIVNAEFFGLRLICLRRLTGSFYVTIGPESKR